MICPKCGSDMVSVLTFEDTHEQFLCTGCPHQLTGRRIDPRYRDQEFAKFRALAEAMREADAGIPDEEPLDRDH